MLRCHCVVPAPVGRCRCLDCNIVLYCLLARCSTTVCALDSLSKYRHHGSTYVSEDGALRAPVEPPLVGRIPCLPVLHPRDKDHPLVRNRGIHYRVEQDGGACLLRVDKSCLPCPSVVLPGNRPVESTGTACARFSLSNPTDTFYPLATVVSLIVVSRRIDLVATARSRISPGTSTTATASFSCSFGSCLGFSSV